MKYELPNIYTNTIRSHSKKYVMLRLLFYVLVILGLWVLLNLKVLREFITTYQTRNTELQSAQVLSKQVKELKKEKEEIVKDNFELEKIAREQYKLIKPGEKLIILDKKEVEEETKE